MAELTKRPPVVMSRPNEARAALPPWTEVWYLLRIEYANARESWLWSVVMVSFFPMVTTFFLKFFMADASPEEVRHVIAGSMVFPIIVMGIHTLAQELATSKHSGHFVFYASLPISKVNFVLATLVSGFCRTLPSVAITSILSQFIFGVRLNYSLALLPVVFLSVGSCVGLGMLMGFLSPNRQFTDMLGNLAMMILSFLTPVYMPVSQLPKVMQWISYLFPTTYVADSLRTLFTAGWQGNVAVNMLILLGFTLGFGALVLWKMDWRVDK